MTPSHVALIEDEEDASKYYKKVLGEESKNHKFDSEDLENGGRIMFETNVYGFNPRLFFHLYMGKLHPDAPYLFCREQREKKGFNLKSNPNVWFEKNKLGINEVSKATPLLCEVLGIEGNFKNNQLRPLSVRNMKKSGAEDRDLMKMTGHKNLKSVDHYDSKLLRERQLDLSRSIMEIPIPKRKSSSISMETKTDENSENESIPIRKRKSSSSMSMEAKTDETSMSMEAKPDENSENESITVVKKPKISYMSMEATSSKNVSIVAHCMEDEYQDEDYDDSEVLTQTPESPKTQEGSYGRSEYLRSEQKLMEQQMKLMAESMKMRYEIALKKFK